jgi:S-adenosylmethionine hydrolase
VAKLKGEVVSVKDSGDLITDISCEQLEGVPRDESVTIKCDGHVTAGIYPSDHQQPALTLLAIAGDETLELSLVGESASAFLGIKPGSTVEVKW